MLSRSQTRAECRETREIYTAVSFSFAYCRFSLHRERSCIPSTDGLCDQSNVSSQGDFCTLFLKLSRRLLSTRYRSRIGSGFAPITRRLR